MTPYHTASHYRAAARLLNEEINIALISVIVILTWSHNTKLLAVLAAIIRVFLLSASTMENIACSTIDFSAIFTRAAERRRGKRRKKKKREVR
jgi:hypothetical protein